jgi:hypothetical protein
VRTGDVVDGRYRLEDNCGSGGCGVVWTAFDSKLKRTVALKRPHTIASHADRLRFRREAETAAQVDHPNAVSVYDTVDGDDCWLVMEYAPATGLDRVLADTGTLPPKRVARIGVQIAAALSAVHAKNIVHRDVKPGNILVGENDFAKLTDFGISLWREVTLTHDGRFSGTPAYSAPEVADGRPVTAASDVFSLGATLFTAVEGIPPFGTGELDEVLARTRRGELLPMRQAGPLAELLSDMLATRQERRPTVDQVRRRLMDIVGEWEPPYPIGRAAAVRTPFWRRSLYQAVAAGTLVAVAAVVGVVLASQDVPPVPEPMAAPPAGNLIGTERTADPCALLDRQALRRFGSTGMDSAYGNFNRCDVMINVGSVENADVEVQLVNRRQRVVDANPFEVVAEPSDNENCDRTMPLDDKYAVRLTVQMPSPPGNLDLCDISDVALETVKTRLHRGPLPQRAPFPPDSLAHVAACPLLGTDALAEVPGIDAASGVLGFGGWECKWHSPVNGTLVHLRYDQHVAGAPVAGQHLPLNGHEARVSLDSNGGISTSCTVRVVYQPVNWTPRRNVDVMVLTVEGERPGEEYCGPATRLAEAAATNLPR